MYSAIYNQLLLKISSVYFFSFTNVSERKICLGVAHCGFPNTQGGPVVQLRVSLGHQCHSDCSWVCVHTNPTHSVPAGRQVTNLASEGALRLQREFWKILKVQ